MFSKLLPNIYFIVFIGGMWSLPQLAMEDCLKSLIGTIHYFMYFNKKSRFSLSGNGFVSGFSPKNMIGYSLVL